MLKCSLIIPMTKWKCHCKKQDTQNNNTYNAYGGGTFGLYLNTKDMPYSYEKNTHDVFNHLVSTTEEAGNKSIYTYYPNNLRYSKQVTDGNNTTYTGFMWGGNKIVLKNQLLWKTGFIAFSLFYLWKKLLPDSIWRRII